MLRLSEYQTNKHQQHRKKMKEKYKHIREMSEKNYEWRKKCTLKKVWLWMWSKEERAGGETKLVRMDQKRKA